MHRSTEVGRLLHSIGLDTEKARITKLQICVKQACGKVGPLDDRSSLKLEACHGVIMDD